MSDSLQPHELQHTRVPCPSPSPGVCLNSCPLSRWCYLTISSSAAIISSCLQSFPASGSFPMISLEGMMLKLKLFASGGQSIRASASASVLPMNIQCICIRVLVTQSCPTLCNPIDCSLPGSPVHGIFQARILAWVDISSSGGSSQPRDRTSSLASPALRRGFFTTRDVT